MLNAIAEGEAKVYNALLGDDCLATIECMAKLGARISIEPDYIAVAGAKIKNSQELLWATAAPLLDY